MTKKFIVLIIISCFALLNCDNKKQESTEKASPDVHVEKNEIDIQDEINDSISSQEKKYHGIKGLEAYYFESILQTQFNEVTYNQHDSIRRFKTITNNFNANKIMAITIKYNPKYHPEENNNEINLPGNFTAIKYESVEIANSEILLFKNKYGYNPEAIVFKSGAIIFSNESMIYILQLNDCAYKSDIKNLEAFIKETINYSNGIKILCGGKMEVF